jgi:putative DNA primase/helicase
MSASNLNTARIWLAVPYEERDEAKMYGAVWDWKSKQWYVDDPDRLMPFKRWMPTKTWEYFSKIYGET